MTGLPWAPLVREPGAGGEATIAGWLHRLEAPSGAWSFRSPTTKLWAVCNLKMLLLHKSDAPDSAPVHARPLRDAVQLLRDVGAAVDARCTDPDAHYFAIWWGIW